MVRIFQILAVALTGAAAFLFWRGDSDMTFVVAVLAACSFFLSFRYQMKARVEEHIAHAKKMAADGEDNDEQTLPQS
jgi:hypothetical protein